MCSSAFLQPVFVTHLYVDERNNNVKETDSQRLPLFLLRNRPHRIATRSLGASWDACKTIRSIRSKASYGPYDGPYGQVQIFRHFSHTAAWAGWAKQKLKFFQRNELIEKHKQKLKFFQRNELIEKQKGPLELLVLLHHPRQVMSCSKCCLGT